MSHLTLGLFLVVVPLLLACTSSPTPTPTPMPDPEAAYIGGLTEIAEFQDQAFQQFQDLLDPVFPHFAPDEIQARVLFKALEAVELSDTVAETLQKLASLTPPERFVEDHTTFVYHVMGQVTRTAAVDEAIQRRDLPHVHLAMAELNAAFGTVRVDISVEFCRYITPETGLDVSGDINLRELYCSDEPIPGGEYGAAINRLAKRFIAQFGPRAAFPPGMTPNELLEGLTYVQPRVVELFNETLAELDATEPPPEYQVGHQVLYDYFSELLSAARAIDRAVGDHDYDRVRREFERSGQIARTADDRLPENYRPLVKIVFGETPGED